MTTARPLTVRILQQLAEVARLWLYAAIVRLLTLLTGWASRVDPRPSPTPRTTVIRGQLAADLAAAIAAPRPDLEAYSARMAAALAHGRRP